MANEKPLILRINDSLKSRLKRSKIGEFLYKNILQPIWRAYHIPHAIKLMDTKGYEVLARIHKVFRKHKIPYYCDAGTLLGFVRDGGFIKGDVDFDFSIIPDYRSLAKVLKALLDEGYRYVYGYSYCGRLLEFTVMDPQVNLTIDVFQSEYCTDDKTMLVVRYLRWFKGRNYQSDRDNSVLEFKFPAPTGIKELTVHGIIADIPENAETILDAEYGPWRVPDPNFKSDMIPHEESSYFAHRVDIDEALRLI